MTTTEALERLKSLDRETRLLEATSAVLAWDQETYMPAKAVANRSEQLSLLQGLIHRRSTSSEVGDLLETVDGDSLDDVDRAFVRETRRQYARLTKVPERLVTEMARTTSIAQAAWAQARSDDDFASFAPHLEHIVALLKEQASCIGYENHPYDALLDEYEPWLTTKEVAAVFDGLERSLAPLVAQISEQPQVDGSFLKLDYPVEGQERFGRLVLERMGYELSRGRLDVSAHPFTISLGPDDVRLTTRYNESMLTTSVFGTIHEGGHGLYELGFDERIRGTILGDGASLGIHESQSRSWENMIGRSRSFWRYFYPFLQREFAGQLGDVDLGAFYRAINRVEPSLIRVEADEVTYCLHIILRFRLETEILTDSVRVSDLPDAWNDRMEALLGVRPDSDATGVLQDIHWSMGSMGYFPTYALGNLYGAQFYASLRKDVPDLDERLSVGDLSPVLEWQRRNIHRLGSIHSAQELCARATGESLSSEFFVDYLKEKYGGIYGL